MSLARTLLSFVVAFAIAFGPFGAAMAAGQGKHRQMAGHHDKVMHAMVEVDHAVVLAADDPSGMADCDHAQPDAAADCRCCDTKAKCPAAACPMTCCKVIGVTRATVLVRMFEPVSYRPNDPLRPPDWSAEPTGPPPRS